MEHTFYLANYFTKLSSWQLNPNQKKLSICLHGWLDNADSFLPLAKILDDREIYAFDFLGHGHSDHLPRGCSYSILLFAQHFIDLIQANNWKNISIIAHSLGTSIAMILAASIPERIKELILIEGFGPFTSGYENFCNNFKEANISFQKKNKTILKKYSSIEEASEERSAKTGIDLKSSKIICTRNLKKVENYYIWRTDPRLLAKSLYPLTEEHFCEFIRNIKCPIKLFLASDSFLRKVSFLDKRIDLIKEKIDIFNLKGHHHIHLQNPEIIKKYLNS